MLARNPKETDKSIHLQDIFLRETLQETGFYFHHSIGKENDSHQDCGCALSKLIGHQRASYENFESLISFWSMMPNHELTEENDKIKEGAKNMQKRAWHSFDESLNSNISFSDIDSK
jgi:hypothetical protein